MKTWITEATLSKMKMKSTHFKRFRDGLILRDEYNRLKNRLNKEINQDKNKYFQTLFSNSEGNMKKSWNALRSLLGTKNKTSTDKIFDHV